LSTFGTLNAGAQTQRNMNISSDLIDMADKDKFLNNIITGDATRCFVYDPQTKQQSSEWK